MPRARLASRQPEEPNDLRAKNALADPYGGRHCDGRRPRAENPARKIQDEIGGAHGVLVTAVSPIAFKQAIGMLRRRGTCVLIGLPPGEFSVSIFDVVLSRYTLRGSIVGTRKDLEEALTFAAEGKVKATIEQLPLDSINEVFSRLREGKVNGRVVLNVA